MLVVEPELEVWLWGQSPHVARALGWDNLLPLQTWLRDHGLWSQGALKPERPKECVEAALRQTGMRRSSSIYGEIARRVSLQGCQDQTFQKLCSVLRDWFPIEAQ